MKFTKAEKIAIDHNTQSIVITSQAKVFGSAEVVLDIDSIQKLPLEYWQQVLEKGFRKPYDEQVWWMRFEVDCKKDGLYFLENQYTMLEDYKLYVIDSKKNVAYYGNAGIRNLEPDSIYPFRNPTFRLNLKSNEQYTFYIYLNKTFSTSALPLYLHSAEAFLTKSHAEETSYGLLYGIFTVLIFQAFISGIYFRSRLHFYYLLYVIGLLGIVLILNGSFRILLPDEWHNAGYFSLYFCIFATFISLYLILFNLLNVKRDFPLLYKIIIGKVVLSIILLSVNTYAYFNLPDFPLKFYRNTNVSIMLYPLFFIFICIGSYIKNREGKALAFLLVFSLTLLFIFSFSLLPFIGYQHNSFLLFRWLIVFEGVIVLIILHRDLYYSKIATISLQQKIIEQQQALSANYIKGISDERKRLSRQLHDSISIKLAALKMKLSGNSHFNTNQLQDIDDIHGQIRAVSHALSPIALEKNGIVAAIEEEIFKLEELNADLVFEFHYNTDNEARYLRAEELIYFTFLELINNVLKYAQATNVVIKLTQEGDVFTLIVEDNGIGYDVMPDGSSGIGLYNISTRAAMVNGSFKIENLQQGTRHTFSISAN